MDKMKTFDLKNGWKIKMYEKNEVFFNEEKVAVVDYDNDLQAIIRFKDREVDFLYTSYSLNPKIVFNENTIVFPHIPEED
ncbi:hypothetical protein M3221_25280 [Domibacillus indicus]|uniref:hypothetical protein n=1 Tax=Domibacillus indicus TaxID=1437523 RepID=UPI002040ED70|nr:hypothetical protein [Domibacillus indicus]MCM3791608.1 hypothetical protein [Domibacillus indicus]